VQRRRVGDIRIEKAENPRQALMRLVPYVRTLLPGLVGGDAGQLQYAARLLVLTHPTGFPLYLAIGHLWSSLVPLNQSQGESRRGRGVVSYV